jgi:RHS repeat-associated protein
LKRGAPALPRASPPAHRLYQLNSGALVTRFQYDGASLVAEYDGANAMLRRYVHGPGSDEPIVWYEGAGTSSRRFLQADERGSVIAVSDSAGASLAINRYDEYGIPQTGNLGRFSYTGQTALPEIGLMYYKARMYSPGLGRFMQTDPIGYGDGLGWYNYVGGDPVNFVDPTGLEDGPIVVNGIPKPKCPFGWTCVDPSSFSSVMDQLKAFDLADMFGSYDLNEIVVTADRQTRYGPCASGVIWTVGLAVDIVPGSGVTLEGGIAFDFSGASVDFYRAYGAADGIDIGGGIVFGAYDNWGALSGSYTADEPGIGPIGVASIRDGNGQTVGNSVTIGPGLPASHSSTYSGHGAVAGVGGSSECILGG